MRVASILARFFIPAGMPVARTQDACAPAKFLISAGYFFGNVVGAVFPFINPETLSLSSLFSTT